MKKLFILFISSFYSASGFTAACCGGGSAGSFLITDNSAFELRLTSGIGKVVAEKFESEKVLFWDTERKQQTVTLTPSFGMSFFEYWQWGVATDLTVKNYRFDQGGSENTQRIGDTRLLVAYEVFAPAPSFSLKPQVFLSLEQVFLTGRGLIESQKNGLSDVSGSEQTQLKFGVHSFKQLNQFRLSSEISISKMFKRTVASETLQGRDQLQLRVGSSYTPREAWSMGLNIGAIFKEGRGVELKSRLVTAPSERYYEVSPFFSYLISPSLLGMITYTDQTILGPVAYTNLSRSFGLSLVYKKLK